MIPPGNLVFGRRRRLRSLAPDDGLVDPTAPPTTDFFTSHILNIPDFTISEATATISETPATEAPSLDVPDFTISAIAEEVV